MPPNPLEPELPLNTPSAARFPELSTRKCSVEPFKNLQIPPLPYLIKAPETLSSGVIILAWSPDHAIPYPAETVTFPPDTFNLLAGEAVPIPTFPLESIRQLSEKLTVFPAVPDAAL